MMKSRKLALNNRYEVTKHQIKYGEFLSSLSEEFNIPQLTRSGWRAKDWAASSFNLVPKILSSRLRQQIQKAKHSIYSLFYDMPLQNNMEFFRRNVAVQHRTQIASICEIIDLVDLDDIYNRAVSSIAWMTQLKLVFNPINDQLASYYRLIVQLQIQIEHLLLSFFTLKEFKRRKPSWKGNNSELILQIENGFVKNTFYCAIKQYLEQEGSKLKHTICKICQESVKVEQMHQHLTICQKEHEIKQSLKNFENGLIQIQEEIKNQHNLSTPLYLKVLKDLDILLQNNQASFDYLKSNHTSELRNILALIDDQKHDQLLMRLKLPLNQILSDISISEQSDINNNNPKINIIAPLSPALSLQPQFKQKKPNSMNEHMGHEFNDLSNVQCKSDRQMKYLTVNETTTNLNQLRYQQNLSELDCSKENSETKSLHLTHVPEKKIAFKDFKTIRLLGKGAFGKVYLVQRRLTKDLYAMKTIELNNDFNKQKLEDLITEHEIFKKIGGEHLVKASFSFTEGSVHFFFMEYMQGGDLAELLEKEVYFTQDVAKYYIAQIILAIEHLHNVGIVHRDLKPNNIVIDRDGHLKLTDFGLSTFDETEAQNYGLSRVVGTPDYMSPEMLKHEDFNKFSADWWSLGVIIYEILAGIKPFGAQTIQEIFKNILACNIEWPQIGYGEAMMTPEAKNLISSLLRSDSLGRLGQNGSNEIKTHAFFNGINWQSLKNVQTKLQHQERPNIKVQENIELTNQIETLINRPVSNQKFRMLDDLVRFDILSQETIKSSEKLKQQNSRRLSRLIQLEKHFA